MTLLIDFNSPISAPGVASLDPPGQGPEKVVVLDQGAVSRGPVS